MYLYRIYFTIEVNCKGIISYAKAHISVRANSEEEAMKILGQNLDIKYAKTDEVKKLSNL